MVINHRASNLFCALSVLIFSAGVHAAEYSSLSQCRGAFYSTTPEGSIMQADAFCKPKMDPIVFCTDQAVLLEQQQAGTPYSAAQLSAANSKYRNMCVASGGASVSVNVASAAPASSIPPNPYGIPLPPDPAAAIAACAGNQTCVQMRQAENQALLNTYNQRVAAASAAAAQAQQQQQQQQQQQNQEGQQQQSNPMAQMAQMLPMMMMGGGQQQQPQVAAPNTGSVAAPAAAPATPAPAAEAPAVAAPSPSGPAPVSATVVNNGQVAENGIDKGAQDVAPIAPAEAAGVAKAADQGDRVDPNAAIVSAGDKEIDELLREIQQGGTPHANSLMSQMFRGTGQEFKIDAVRKHLEDFINAKKTCTQDAGKAETLCVEGTSPGAQAARMLMDAAGPAMLAMNAQKACNSTSKVTNLAGLGLTAANGVCMATKMKCEKNCKAADELLGKAKAAIAKSITDKFPADEKQVRAMNATNPSVETLINGARQEMQSGIKAIDSAIDRHRNRQLGGTATALQAKCEDKMRNIIGMMANIASLFAAKKSADDCDKKLSAPGQAGGTLTAKQYCEDSANSGTQFCRCQTNSGAEGCPSSLIAAPGTDSSSGSNPNDVAGADIRPNSGLSNFAGGFKGGGTPTGGANMNLGGSGGSEAGDSSSPFGASSPGAAAMNTAAGGGGLGASGGSAAAAEAAKKGKDDDDKKWSFGAMAAGVGSMFGGGNKGGSSGNGDLKNVNPALEANIQRKIASDRLGMEVTPASGISNWDKVHKTIIRVENTLMRGN